MRAPAIEVRSVAAVFGPPLALILVGFVLFRSAGTDDPFITYWAARTLAESGEILNLSGERFEQSTSLLHVIVLAVAAKVSGVSVETVGYLMAIGFGAVAVVLAGRLAERLRPGTGVWAALLAALSSPLVYWSYGGLEATLAAALLVALTTFAIAVVSQGRRASPGQLVGGSALSLGLAMVRPDLPLVWICVCLILLAVGALGRRHGVAGLPDPGGAAVVLGMVVVALVGVTTFRLAYFGELVPQPVLAKVGGVGPADGVEYLIDTARDAPGFAVLGLVAVAGGALLLTERRFEVLAPLLVCLGVVGQVVVAGGDWMEIGRMFVPIVPITAALAAVVLDRFGWRTWQRAALVGVLGLGLLVGAWRDSRGTPFPTTVTFEPAGPAPQRNWPTHMTANRPHFRDIPAVETVRPVLERLVARNGTVTVASGQAGMVPYYAFHDLPGVTFIDLRGLTSDDLADCPEASDRTQFGWQVTYEGWFGEPDRCGVEPPDVIIDIGRFDRKLGNRSEYVEVFRTRGRIVHSGQLLTGVRVPGDQFVAVRRDLLALLDDTASS